MSTRSSGDVLLAFVIGGVIGAGLAILYAPASGKETRKKLTAMEEDIVSGAEDMIEKGKEKIMHEKNRIEDMVNTGIRSFHKAH